jgi:hypothetical protein
LRSVSELAGESLREIGILLVVFVPLDAVFSQGELHSETIIALAILIIVGVVLIFAGISLEEG